MKLKLFILISVLAITMATSLHSEKKTLSISKSQIKSVTEKVITEKINGDKILSKEQSIPSFSDSEVTSLTLTGSASSTPTLSFSNSESGIEIDLASSGDLEISGSSGAIATISSNGNLDVDGTLTAESVEFDGPLNYGSNPQWRQFVNENFWSPPSGWSLDEVTLCGGAYLLGGYCILSRGQLQKEYSGLPTHTQLQITGVFHYIDSWNGESAYLQLNSGPKGENVYVWMDRYDSSAAVAPTNICGSPIGEGRFGIPISVVIPHTSSSVTVTFGSTADQDPCDQSWGISNLAINIQ